MPDIAALQEIERRVLWLAVRMVDAANRERSAGDGLKVGGHQSSSASLVTAMTALYFGHLNAADRVCVKPQAAPVFHAIQYLLGRLDRSLLTRLREPGGLQAYPSNVRDPDPVDFTTGSIGLGPPAPLFAAAVRRYVDAHFGARPASRFIALMGDAELGEGSIWESISDPVTQGLGNVLWVVDYNRQSLDGFISEAQGARWMAQFEAVGWHVLDVRYGQHLRAAFAQPGGSDLRSWLENLPVPTQQSLASRRGEDLRDRLCDGAPEPVRSLLAAVPTEDLPSLLGNLGGHDLESMLDAFRAADAVTDRPSVIFAHTVKGWHLPTAGDPQNHYRLLSVEDIDRHRVAAGLSLETEWDRLDPESPAGALAARRARELTRQAAEAAPVITIADRTAAEFPGEVSTQDAFGRIMAALASDPAVAPYLVTASPDVTTATGLTSYVTETGVFRSGQRHEQRPEQDARALGHHFELGISESNLFLLLAQLGRARELSDQALLPVGTVYDPFLGRGLDALVQGLYSGGRFIVVGTPSGITLAPEGGAHQSSITPSIGLELPGLTAIEPAYATPLDWLFCDALSRLAAGDEQPSTSPVEDAARYFRLTTRPLDQSPFEGARRRLGTQALRRQVLGGAYRLVSVAPRPGQSAVCLAASGAVMPEVLAAARALADEGVAADVVDVTSLDRLYRGWRRWVRDQIDQQAAEASTGLLSEVFPRGAPIVTVHDAASHAMSWLGSALGVRCISLGVDEFGQSGSIEELYGLHQLLPDSIVRAARVAMELSVAR